jgi:hypothetical protein
MSEDSHDFALRAPHRAAPRRTGYPVFPSKFAPFRSLRKM